MQNQIENKFVTTIERFDMYGVRKWWFMWVWDIWRHGEFLCPTLTAPSEIMQKQHARQIAWRSLWYPKTTRFICLRLTVLGRLCLKTYHGFYSIFISIQVAEMFSANNLKWSICYKGESLRCHFRIYRKCNVTCLSLFNTKYTRKKYSLKDTSNKTLSFHAKFQ